MQSRDSKPEETKAEVHPTVDPPKPTSVEDRLAALEADYAAFKAHVGHIVGEAPTPPSPPAET